MVVPLRLRSAGPIQLGDLEGGYPPAGESEVAVQAPATSGIQEIISHLIQQQGEVHGNHIQGILQEMNSQVLRVISAMQLGRGPTPTLPPPPVPPPTLPRRLPGMPIAGSAVPTCASQPQPPGPLAGPQQPVAPPPAHLLAQPAAAAAPPASSPTGADGAAAQTAPWHSTQNTGRATHTQQGVEQQLYELQVWWAEYQRRAAGQPPHWDPKEQRHIYI